MLELTPIFVVVYKLVNLLAVFIDQIPA